MKKLVSESAGPNWARVLILHKIRTALILIALSLLLVAEARARESSAVIQINLRDPGRTYEGIGGLSAGASSRLLFDYPEPERTQILDYLFKPGYGANLQILKVEIGGDSNSTCGSEPSHMRLPDDLNADRGYEWWLMKEAKARNPEIKLWALEWCAPAWFKGGFWSKDNIDYLLAWIKLAEQKGLSIDYVGGWNESGSDPDWYIAWHKALSEHFPHIKIVAADDVARPKPTGGRTWASVEKMAANPAFLAAVDIIGIHDPDGARTEYLHCPIPEYARGLNKPIWDSELSSQGHDVGAIPLARALNRQYIEGRMTSNVVWSLISAWYADLPLADTGLMLADRPWSGYYKVGKDIWVHAHTAQFASIGWQYIDSACGYLPDGASYVTLKSPDARNFCTVIETMDTSGPQVVDFLTSGLSPGQIHLWSTDLSSENPSDYFVHQNPIQPKAGAFSVTLLPKHLYTLTTTAGQGRGTAHSRKSPVEQLPLPYKEDFEGYKRSGNLARFFSDIEGGFETARCGAGRKGFCYRQSVTTQPITWGARKRLAPTTVVGDPRWWGDYEVGADVLLEQQGAVELLGRVSSQRGVSVAGYHFKVGSDGRWSLYSQDLEQPSTELSSGTVDFGIGLWRRMELRFTGRQIEALWNGKVLTKVADDHHLTGQVGLSVVPWCNAEFDNIEISKTTPWPHFIAHEEMKATATSEHAANYRGYTFTAANAIDDRPETGWSAEWTPKAPLPQSITLDLGHDREVHGLTYQPRLDGKNSGHVSDYRISSSHDGRSFSQLAQGYWPISSATKVAAWPAQSMRYVRLEATEKSNGAPMAGEINLSETELKVVRGSQSQE